MSPRAPWPPRAGELLPRAANAFGVRYKLATYSLDVTHKDGGPKARGFARILGITLDDIDYLAATIEAGVLEIPISEVRENPPWGMSCVVMVPTRGRGQKNGRVVNVRTVWELASSDAPPRLANAYLRP
jgi:hypothetical protein